MIEQDIEIALIEAKEGIEQSITKRGVIAGDKERYNKHHKN